MDRISVLDCTLRDGGYCNQWRFGENNIKNIISGIVESGIRIIECGFLSNKASYSADITKYTEVAQISGVIPHNRSGQLYVAMMNYGEYTIDDLPLYDGSSIDGIRLAFHKKMQKMQCVTVSLLRKKAIKFLFRQWFL